MHKLQIGHVLILYDMENDAISDVVFDVILYCLWFLVIIPILISKSKVKRSANIKKEKKIILIIE